MIFIYPSTNLLRHDKVNESKAYEDESWFLNWCAHDDEYAAIFHTAKQ